MRIQQLGVIGLFLGWAVGAFSAEFIPVQQRAQGHSLTGASQLNDSLYTNPAASSFTNVYAVDGAFLMPKSFAVSILDTKTSAMGGTLGYFRHLAPDRTNPLQGAKFGLSGKVDDSIAVGAAGKMLWGPDAHGDDAKLHDLDFGALANLGIVHLGFTVRNVLGGKPELEIDREWSAGGRIGYQETLFLSVATTSNSEKFSPYQYGIGVEYISPFFLAFKGGYRLQPDAHKSYWGAGASFVSPKISFHYGVEFPQQHGEKTEHIIGTTLLF